MSALDHQHPQIKSNLTMTFGMDTIAPMTGACSGAFREMPRGLRASSGNEEFHVNIMSLAVL